MFPHVIEACHLGNHTIRFVFDDGLAGAIDLAPYLKGPIFEPLQDVAEFARFELDSKAGTICWPNGADIAPEFLHEKLRLAQAAE